MQLTSHSLTATNSIVQVTLAFKRKTKYREELSCVWQDKAVCQVQFETCLPRLHNVHENHPIAVGIRLADVCFLVAMMRLLLSKKKLVNEWNKTRF